MEDKRFSHISTDPRFRSIPKRQRKVKIDKRFEGMFKDDRFKLKYSVDKKGRPLNKTSEEDLKRFYELSDEDDSLDEDISQEKSQTSKLKTKLETKEKKQITKKSTKTNLKEKNISLIQKKSVKSRDMKNLGAKTEVNESESEEEGTVAIEPQSPGSDKTSESGVGTSLDLGKGSHLDPSTGPDLARGEGNVSSSSEDEDEDWQPDLAGGDIEHNWGEEEKDVPCVTELSHRLAVCNMDWDRIKARDLYVLFSSFLPTGGIIHSVKVYPSEYGQKMMEEENRKGPAKFITSGNMDEKADEDLEGNEFNMERLRQYQLNRLKYFYAVVDCDTVETANHIYKECDGLEYETSSAKIDLRFIPDGMEFDQSPHSVCEETPESATFQPSTFLTTALCQSKVELTWDETDRDRVATTRKKLTPEEINDADYKAYLASSSDEETEDPYKGLVEDDGIDSGDEAEDSKIEKYKSLVKELETNEKQKEDREVEMEITWEPGLKEATEDIVKKKGDKKELTVWEQYLEKKKDKKRKKREEKLMDKDIRHFESKQSVEDEETAFSDDELPENIDTEDPFFMSELESSKTNKKSNIKKRKEKKPKLTPFEQEELDQNKAELSLLMMEDDAGENKQHFNLKKLINTEEKSKKKRKRNVEKQEPEAEKDMFQFNMEDSRFKAMFDSHVYNLDPSAPEFKRTKVMENIIEEKLKRRKTSKKTDSNSSSKDSTKKYERNFVSKKEESISDLVKSVKSKTKNYHSKKL